MVVNDLPFKQLHTVSYLKYRIIGRRAYGSAEKYNATATHFSECQTKTGNLKREADSCSLWLRPVGCIWGFLGKGCGWREWRERREWRGWRGWALDCQCRHCRRICWKKS